MNNNNADIWGYWAYWWLQNST